MEFYSQNRFEKLVRVIGFIIRIYHDARSSERQIPRIYQRNRVQKTVIQIKFIVISLFWAKHYSRANRLKVSDKVFPDLISLLRGIQKTLN